MPEAVLLEFEGVLAQTNGLRRAAVYSALASRGMAPPVQPELRLGSLSVSAAVNLVAESCGLRLDETERDLIAVDAEREFAQRAAVGLTLVDGARECISRLHSSTRLGIVTRSGRREVESALSLAGLEFAFECVVAREDVSLPKPSPRGYELALERLSSRRPITPGEVIALEDSVEGIRAARSAGVLAIAVGDVPPDEAVEADGYLPSLVSATAASLDELLRGAARMS